MRKLTIALVGLALVGMIGLADAQSREQGKEALKQKGVEGKEELMEKKEEMAEKRCERLEARLQNRINRYEENGGNFGGNLSNLQEGIEDIIALMKVKGLDVSQLETDLQTLIGMIEEYQTLNQKFMEELKRARNSACGGTQEQYQQELNQAREMMKEVKGQVDKIRDFYRTEIRPEILRLRDELIALQGEEE